jgi:NOL1/NOP2/sun family putative RNA methylase
MAWKERKDRVEDIEVKDSFEEHYKTLLGNDYTKFMDCNAKYLRRAIRVNTLKADVEDVKNELEANGWTLTPVPWCKEAFWIQGDRLDIGNLLAHQRGDVYIQDPASMLPPIVLQPQPGERVLDMCASPGSKTTQAAAMMQNTGVIVANDTDGGRLAPLGMNTQRLGVVNTIITKRDGRHFGKFEFDKVMIDAPCSGTGTIRRSLKSIGMYNPKQVLGLSRLQKQLLDTGYKALKSGGVLTYSTCTLEPLENEVVVDEFLKTHPEAIVEDFELDIKREEVFTKHPRTNEPLSDEIQKCLRIHPYTNDTEGFFVCRIKKP